MAYVGVLKLPRAMKCWPDVIGKEWPTRIGEIDVKVQMPIHASDAADETGLSPLANPTTSQNLDDFDVWGYAEDHVCEIFAVALTCTEPVNESSIKSMFAEVDTWLECVYAWLSAWTGQAIHIRDEVPYRRGGAVTLQFWSEDEHGTGQRVRGPASILALPGMPVRSTHLRDSLRRGADLQCPPLERQFLSDALVAHLRLVYRRATIDACTSVEIVVNDVLRSMRDQVGSKAAKVINSRAPLGPRIEIARDLGAPLPEEVDELLLYPRNAAVHEGLLPNKLESSQAWELSKEIVNQLSPLDRPTPEGED